MSEKTPSKVETWDPFREFDLFRSWAPSRLFGGLREGGIAAPTRWAPSLDLSENDTNYIVTVELAGAKKDDVHVEIDDGVLTIRGEKKSEREEENEERRYTERSYGMFSRSFTLPSNAKDDDVKAAFDDGVLNVEIGKGDEPKAKAVQIR